MVHYGAFLEVHLSSFVLRKISCSVARYLRACQTTLDLYYDKLKNSDSTYLTQAVVPRDPKHGAVEVQRPAIEAKLLGDADEWRAFATGVSKVLDDSLAPAWAGS